MRARNWVGEEGGGFWVAAGQKGGKGIENDNGPGLWVGDDDGGLYDAEGVGAEQGGL